MERDTSATMDCNPECNICYETIKPTRKTINTFISCMNAKCEAVYHTSCFMDGITHSSVEPKCFVCEKSFPEHLMYSVDAVNQRKYRDHMAVKDLEKEKNLLPSAQFYLSELKRAEELDKEACDLQMRADELARLAHEKRMEAFRIRKGKEKVPVEKASFVCPCPGEKCNGFLNTKYFCTLCNTKVCHLCRVDITGKEEHECNEDDVKSTEMIKKTTKPCPECGVRIHKPSGCDHMFCTNPGCNTSFSWRTGRKIDESVNTNPYYYEWKRQQPGGLQPRNNECTATMNSREVIREISFNRGVMNNAKLHKLIRKINHVIGIDIPKYSQNPFEKNRDLAIKYLTNEFSEESWTKTLKKRRKKAVLYSEIHKILEAYIECCADTFRGYLQTFSVTHMYDKEGIDNMYTALMELKKLFQGEMNEMIKNFGSKMKVNI